MLAGLGALVGVVSLAAVALVAGVIILALCVKTTIILSHYIYTLKHIYSSYRIACIAMHSMTAHPGRVGIYE